MEKSKRNVSGSSVAVIGGAGFLGSHLVEHLLKRGCKVVVVDNLMNGKFSHIPAEAKFVWFDIRDDENELAKILLQHRVRFVFNAAAEPYIPESFERPMHFFDINARAVLSVLNACQKASIEAILQVSSAEIYGDLKGKIKESDPIQPHSTYGVSKVAADGLVQVRWREAGVPAIAVRQFNAVGERETHAYVIPEIVSQLAAAEPLMVHGLPIREDGKRVYEVKLGNNSTRDFLYAGDVADGWIALLERGEFGEVYNFGSEDAISIYDLATLIGTIMGRTARVVQDKARVRPWEIWHLQSDNTKFFTATGYKPETNLAVALDRTVGWFRLNGSKWPF